MQNWTSPNRSLIRGLQQVLKFGGAFLRRERDYQENVLGLPGSNLGGGGDLLNRCERKYQSTGVFFLYRDERSRLL